MNNEFFYKYTVKQGDNLYQIAMKIGRAHV